MLRFTTMINLEIIIKVILIEHLNFLDRYDCDQF